MKFKVGNKVRITKEVNEDDSKYGMAKGTILTIKEVDEVTEGVYCKETGDRVAWSDQIELVSKRGRPCKTKKIKFIVQYDLEDGDPVKEFYSRPELMKWLQENQDSDVIWDSIKVYPVDKVWKPKANIKISLRKV